jgi:hypothetical protein
MYNLPKANADFTFTPGHLYGTFYDRNGRDIIEYSETGAVLGSLIVPSLIPGDELRGIVFGPDGFLYAVKVNQDNIPGFSVLVLDSSGTVQNTYTYTNVFFDYLSYGKIALDQQYIYVAGGTGLFRFTLGDPSSGVPIYSNNGYGIFDVKTLPNGHLFVAYAYGVDEITNTGTIVRSIPLIGALWVDVRGIEYDPAINKLFATELGYSFFLFQLMRIDASTGVLENHVSFGYGDDLFLTRSNTLLVGSQSQAPAIYDENLTFIAPLGTVERAFVTQCPTTGPTPTPTPTHPPFFMGEVPLGNGVYYLQFPNRTPFGYYAYLSDQRFIYHFDMGYEYWFDTNDGQSGIYFYDFMSNHSFYTSPSFPFPYLYDFSLNTVLYYYPDTNNPGHYTTNPRYFYNIATGQIITM